MRFLLENPSPDLLAHPSSVSILALMVDLEAGAPQPYSQECAAQQKFESSKHVVRTNLLTPHPARSILVSHPIPHSAVGSIVLNVSLGGSPYLDEEDGEFLKVEDVRVVVKEVGAIEAVETADAVAEGW